MFTLLENSKRTPGLTQMEMCKIIKYAKCLQSQYDNLRNLSVKLCQCLISTSIQRQN